MPKMELNGSETFISLNLLSKLLIIDGKGRRLAEKRDGKPPCFTNIIEVCL